jgi:hypothetical protein
VSLGETIPETVPQILLYATPPNVPVDSEPVIDMPVILDCWRDSDIGAERLVPGDAARGGIVKTDGVPTSAAHRTILAKRNRLKRGMGIDAPSQFLVMRSIMPIEKAVYIKLSLRSQRATRGSPVPFCAPPCRVRFALTMQPRYNRASRRTCRIRPVH